MNKLINDSETFQKERPTKATKEQLDQLYTRLAQEIIQYGWSKNNINTIKQDLEKVGEESNGYDVAMKLEDWGNGYYEVDSAFVEWLDSLWYEHKRLIYKNEKAWVKAHDIKPKYQKGHKIVLQKNLLYRTEGYQKGDTIYINGHSLIEGKYKVNTKLNSESNYVIEYEKLEA